MAGITGCTDKNSNNPRWAAVSSTSYVTYAIKTDGALHGWFSNDSGSLGDETSWQKTSVKLE